MARPGGTLKGEDDRRFRLYTVIRIKIRSRVSVAREIGFRLSIAAAGRSAPTIKRLNRVPLAIVTP